MASRNVQCADVQLPSSLSPLLLTVKPGRGQGVDVGVGGERRWSSSGR
jgi:hypothetical protein